MLFQVLIKKTNLKPLFDILVEWLIIVIALLFFITYSKFYIMYPIIFFIIGTRQYALYCLLHEGIHFNLHPNKKINDGLSNCLLAIPLFINLKGMRNSHFEHHKHLLSEKDPEQKHKNYNKSRFY